MKASKFSDAQKAFIIRQGEDGTPVEEVCRKAGISQATYYAWKKKYAGMMPSEMKRMREFEEEKARLKRIVADLSRFWRGAGGLARQRRARPFGVQHRQAAALCADRPVADGGEGAFDGISRSQMNRPGFFGGY